MATLDSIQAKIAKLQAQATALATTKSTAVLEKIRGLMEKHGVSVAEIEAFVGKRRGRKPQAGVAAKQGASAAKYADPKTGATWTGHGRAPAWIAEAKDRTKFLVAGGAAKSAVAAQVAPKAGNYVRGTQPTLYRDPKTGATWSGRGRAPAWLASVKDRSKFLITEAVETAATPKAKAVKAVAAKNAVAKEDAATKKKPAKKAAVKNAAMKTMAAKTSAPISTKLPAKKAPARKAAVKTVVARNAVSTATPANTQVPELQTPAVPAA